MSVCLAENRESAVLPEILLTFIQSNTFFLSLISGDLMKLSSISHPSVSHTDEHTFDFILLFI